MHSCQLDREVKARKNHTCDECGRTIEKGDMHHVQSGIFDGQPYRWRVHSDCAELYWKYNKDLNTGWCYDEYPLSEMVQDELNHYRGYFPHAVCRLEFGYVE